MIGIAVPTVELALLCTCFRRGDLSCDLGIKGSRIRARRTSVVTWLTTKQVCSTAACTASCKRVSCLSPGWYLLRLSAAPRHSASATTRTSRARLGPRRASARVKILRRPGQPRCLTSDRLRCCAVPARRTATRSDGHELGAELHRSRASARTRVVCAPTCAPTSRSRARLGRWMESAPRLPPI